MQKGDDPVGGRGYIPGRIFYTLNCDIEKTILLKTSGDIAFKYVMDSRTWRESARTINITRKIYRCIRFNRYNPCFVDRLEKTRM